MEAVNSGPKRTLFPLDDELRESNEMDNDPNTRIVSSIPKRRRAAERTLIAISPFSVSTISQAKQSEQHKPAANENNAGGVRYAQQQTVVTEEAERFAQPRYPFSPFVIIMDQNVRDKIVIEFFCKYVKDNHRLDLEVAGYRGAAKDGPSGGYKILLFVKTIDTFSTLLDQKIWPQEICGHKYKLVVPSIPPQLAGVIPDVPMNITMEEFIEEIHANFEHIISVVRLRNRFQREIKVVKVEFNSVTARKNMLDKNHTYCGTLTRGG
jgi:hypothetical protein